MVSPWTPDGYAEHAPEDLPKACPGYTCKLPEVIEAVRAHLHWSKGQLDTFTRGETASEILSDSIEIVDGSRNAVERWLMKQRTQE